MFESIVTGGLLDDKLVRNKPLAAVFESETVQNAANAPSVVRRVTTTVYRDSDGRTRREQIFHSDSTVPSPGEVPPSYSIYDPVSGYGYSVNPSNRTAQRYKLPSAPNGGAPFDNRIPSKIEIRRNDNPLGGTDKKYTLEPPRVEPLGKQTIAGVEAHGKRVTIKVPAGAIGNAEPIETMYETWIAADLQMLVKSIARNPLSGEHRFRLTMLDRSIQRSSLFEIPAGYLVTEMGVKRTGQTPTP
jgi:hypothetical protein